MVSFFRSFEEISLNDINKFEKFIGLKFPKLYVDFLLQHNGGKCTPNIFTFKEHGENTQSDVHWFLGIHDGTLANLKDFCESYKIYEKRMPSHILPIAHDSGGNVICISCGQKDNGQIFFWDHENEVDYSESDDSDYSNLYFIADDLKQFLDELKEEDDDE